MYKGASTSLSAATLWVQSSSKSFRMGPSNSQIPTARRYFGWNTLSMSQPASKDVAVLSSSVNGTLSQMCCQDVFTGFLRALLSTCDRPFGGSGFSRCSEGYGIENQCVKDLIDSFVQNGLGSRRDAVLCIIPVIVASKCKSPIQDAIEAALKLSSRHMLEDKTGEAVSELRWALSILDDSLSEDQARECIYKLSGIYRHLLAGTQALKCKRMIINGTYSMLKHYRKRPIPHIQQT